MTASAVSELHPDDEALLERAQRECFRYFWDFAHPVSGLARDRSRGPDDPGDDTMAIGGSGFGVMAMLVAIERGWIGRGDAVSHIANSLDFLANAERFHGAFPHFMDGKTGKAIAFGELDDGADLVETSLLIQGLLAARQYFDGTHRAETELRAAIDKLWHEVEWDWFLRGGTTQLYWHWSPRHEWKMNFLVRGWNECLITYLLAVAAPRHAIPPEAYHTGWATGHEFLNGKDYYGVTLPLGPEYGGPLFFTHYSFMGLDPRGLEDRYANYWQQNQAHALINYRHCQENPNGYLGYGPDCWGLTASDTVDGYTAHAPDRDKGVISPTAAVASVPYLPEQSLAALRRFSADPRLWGRFGLIDAFSETHDWYAPTHLAIDQGPIVVMVENFRSGLLWKHFMTAPEIREGLRKLEFHEPALV